MNNIKRIEKYINKNTKVVNRLSIFLLFAIICLKMKCVEFRKIFDRYLDIG